MKASFASRDGADGSPTGGLLARLACSGAPFVEGCASVPVGLRSLAVSLPDFDDSPCPPSAPRPHAQQA